MDNRIFNINGKGREMLERTLDLALVQANKRGFASWIVDPERGLVLCWLDKAGTPFLGQVGASAVAEMVMEWLKTDKATAVPPGRMCENHHHDGSNSAGWQVYCEDWGYVGANEYAICAVRPAYLWHGK